MNLTVLSLSYSNTACSTMFKQAKQVVVATLSLIIKVYTMAHGSLNLMSTQAGCRRTF